MARARSFNLTAEINLRGPANIRTVVADIRRQLGTINVSINPQINANAQRNITNLNRSLTTLNTTLNNTTRSANNAAQAINNFNNAMTNAATNNFNRNLNNAATNANNLGNAVNNTNRQINNAATGMEEFGRQSALAIRRFAAFSVVTSAIYSFTGAVSKGVKAFIDFDKEFVRLQQVTGQSAKGLRGLSGEITNLATTLGVASSDLTTVAVTLAQAGLSARETEKALKALALSSLAPSFDDMNQTVEGSIALMRQFNISADQLESALGSVNAVAAAFAVEASDLITAIQRTGGVFATASKGVSEGTDALNEFLAVFTSIRATTRESAETIATGLRTIFARIQRKDTIDALRQYGVMLTDLEGKFVGPYEAVKRLSEGLSKLDPRDLKFSQIVEELGGFRQIGKVIPLIQQFTVAQRALGVAQKGSSSLTSDAATAQLSLANQIAKVREEFTALIRKVGESDSFRTMVKMALDLASALIKLADAITPVLPALTAMAAFKGVRMATQFGRGFRGGLGFATGGLVPGTGNSDTVSARLTPGEYVIRKKAVQTIGADRLAALNSGSVQKFAAGTMVKPPKKAMGVGGIGIFDSDKIPGGTNIKKALLDQIKASRKPYSVISGPAGSGKTTFATTKFGSNFILNPQDISKYSRFVVLSGAGKTKSGDFSEDVKNLLGGASDITVLAPSSERLIKQRQSRLESALSGNVPDTRSTGVLEGTLKAPTDINEDLYRRYGNVSVLREYARGGSIQKFKNGSKVLSKKEKLARQRAAETGLQFGLVGLFGGRGVAGRTALDKNKTPVSIRYGSLDEQIAQKYEGLMKKGIEEKVILLAKNMARRIGATATTDKGSIEKMFQKAGISTAIGPMVESVIGLSGPPFDDALGPQNASIDFPTGIGGRSQLFGIPSNIPTDATRNVSSRGKGISKFIGQISRYLDRQNITAQPQLEQAVKSSATAPPMATNPNLEKFQSGVGYTDAELTASGFSRKNRGSYFIQGPGRKWLRRATGGSISGKDTVPALLTPGEFVLNKDAASRLGPSRLHALNNADKIQGYNKGGVVQRFFGGGGLDQKLVQTSADLEAAIQKVMMNLESAAKNAQDAAYKQARSQGKTAKEALDIGRQQASAVVSRMAPNDAIGQEAKRRLLGNNVPGTNITGSSASMSVAGQQFALSLKNATTPLQQLTQAARNAGSGLLQVGKSSIAAVGRGAGGLVGKVGGGVLNAVGLGKFSSRGAAAGGGGGDGGMAGIALTMAGGLVSEGLSSAMGGNKTEAGRTTAAVGNSIANMAALGATIGSIIPGVGTAFGGLVGATAGLVVGFQDAKRANEEYVQSQRKEAADKAQEKASTAVQTYASGGGNREQALSSLKSSIEQTSAYASNIKGEKAGFFSEAETAASVGSKRAEASKATSETAIKFAEAEMMKTGKTYAQISSSLDPQVTKAIASGDEAYQTLQENRNREIAKLKSEGRNAEAERVQALTNSELDQYAKTITERRMKEKADAMAASKASARLTSSLEKAAYSIETRFAQLDQAFNVSAFQVEQLGQNIENMASGKVSLTTNQNKEAANVLSNPDVYSREQRQAAMSSVGGVFGVEAGRMQNMANFSRDAKDTALAAAQRTGGGAQADLEVVRRNLKNSVMSNSFTLGDVAGPVSEQIDKAINEALEKVRVGEVVNLDKVIEEALGPAGDMSKKAMEAFAKAAEDAQKKLDLMAKTAESVADINAKIKERNAGLAGMTAKNNLSLKESLGIKVTSRDKREARMAASASRLGVRPDQVNTSTILGKRQQLLREQQNLQSQQGTMQKLAPGDPRLQQFMNRLAAVNKELATTDKELQDLPDAIQGSIDDMMGEIQQRIQDLEAQKQAASVLGEKLVTSTPKELQDLNRTYARLDNILKGQIESIQQSSIAMKAYNDAIKEGKTRAEAMDDAQKAYADDNKKVFDLFNELSAFSGIKSERFDFMKSNIIETMARQQGTLGNPFITEIIDRLRMTPEQRAQSDPELLALQSAIAAGQQQQADAINAANAIDQQISINISGATAELKRSADALVVVANRLGGGQPAQQNATGGLIYAQQGQLVNFKPKGTDTVPAMLTKGEYVVNAKDTQKNLGLLNRINSGQQVEYKAQGGVAGIPQWKQNIFSSLISGLSPDRFFFGAGRDNERGGAQFLDGSGDSKGLGEKLLLRSNLSDYFYNVRARNQTEAANIAKDGPIANQINETRRAGKLRIINGQQMYRFLYDYMTRMTGGAVAAREAFRQASKFPQILRFTTNSIPNIQGIGAPDNIARIFGVPRWSINLKNADEQSAVLWRKIARGNVEQTLPRTIQDMLSRKSWLEYATGNINQALTAIENDPNSFPEAVKWLKVQKSLSSSEINFINIMKDRVIRKAAEDYPNIQLANIQPRIERSLPGAPGGDTPSSYFSKGGTVYAQNGQPINFKPKGTDNIPAMLSKNEYVVNAKDATKNRDLLNTINSGAMSRGGRVTYLANGSGTREEKRAAYEKEMERRRQAYADGKALRAQAYYASRNMPLPEKLVAPVAEANKRREAQQQQQQVAPQPQNNRENGMAGFSNFGQYVDKLSKINLPNAITFNHTGTISVEITGAAALEAMNDKMLNMIDTAIANKMAELNIATEGGLGGGVRTKKAGK